MKTQQRNTQDYKLFALAEKKAAGKTLCLLTSAEIMDTLGLSSIQTARLLTRLVSQGRIGQLQRKLYIAPGRLPPGKLWKPSAYLVLACYMEWLKAKWQITGWDAFARYGFSTQISQKVFLYNDKLSGEFLVAGSKFVFIKIPVKKIGFRKSYIISESNLKLFFSSKARALFDAVIDYNRFGTIPRSFGWITTISKDKNLIKELINCTYQLGNKSTIQRIGFILDKLEINKKLLLKLKQKIKKSSLVCLTPGSRSGPINKTWNIIENIPYNTLMQNKE